MKKIVSFLLLVAICFAMIIPCASAATVKITKSKLTLNEGSSYNLQVTGTAKKVTWSTSDKEIARVTSKGKVTAVKAGTATITAKVNTKKYTCKVTVKDVLTNEEAAAKITYESIKFDRDMILIFTNKNKVNTQIQADVTYYDINGDVLSTSSQYIWNFQAGSKAVEVYSYPHDDSYNPVEFDSFDVKITADLGSFKVEDVPVEQLSIVTNKGSDNMISEITNNSEADLVSAELTILYYSGSVIVGYDEGYLFDDVIPGEKGIVEFTEPYDKNYKDIAYDDYEVIINEASFE